MEPLPKFEDAAPAKLTPSMASFKVLVLSFVTQYIIRNQLSPSQGEIVSGLHSTRSRVRDAIRSLAKDGLLVKGAGERGLSLPSEGDAAIRQLIRQGWIMVDGVLYAPTPGASPPDPIFTVPGLAELDYP